MAKKENSGIVLVKYLSKLVTLSFLLAGCSSTIDSRLAEKQWQERFDYCQHLALENKVSLPDSEWFDSLTHDDKKSVIGYLANYTERKCMGTVTDTLKQSLLAENNQEKLEFYSVDLTPLNELAAERIKHLNQKELKQLTNQVNKPFNLRYVLKQQNLYPKM